MAETKKTAPAAPKASATETREMATSTAALASREEEAHRVAAAPVAPELRTAEGGKGAGPKSAIKGGHGSEADADTTKNLRYSVQIHTDEKGLEVFEPIDADSGDDAARQALAKKNFHGASVRGVTPYSDPDPNSLGGERDAAIMISNANNDGAIINTLGTDANADMTRKLAKADIKDLGE